LRFPTSSLEKGQVWKASRPASQTPYRPAPWPRVVKSYRLGHASIATTQGYLDHLELGELRQPTRGSGLTNRFTAASASHASRRQECPRLA
jgi:hypothetical protein